MLLPLRGKSSVAAKLPGFLPSLRSGLSFHSSLATGAPAPFASGFGVQCSGKDIYRKPCLSRPVIAPTVSFGSVTAEFNNSI